MSSHSPARGRSISVIDTSSSLLSSDESNQQSSKTSSKKQRRLSSFLHLHMPSNIHDSGIRSAGITPDKSLSASVSSQLQFLHIPTVSITSPNNENNKRFIFGLGLRRHSNVTLHKSESMVSLCYRSLAGFIVDNNLQALHAFLENKQILIDDRDENGTTALMLAASKGRTQFVRDLLAHGADANAEDNDGWTALKCAAKEGFADICALLIQHGAQLEHRDSGGWTALMWASYKGRIDAVQCLIEQGADVNAHGNYHISSLLWASGRGYTRIVQMLVSNGAKINVGDKYGTTALVWACRRGHYEIVDCLLKSGANVDTAGMYSWTPLLVASMGNYVDVVNRLLEHKPNVNALDKDGCTALTIACKEGYHDIVVALLNAGAYINIQDRAGDTNLIHAVKGNHRSVVEALLKKYADVDTAGKDRKTAIYNAVEKGNVQIVKILLNANPDLEIATKDGDTPLLRAVRIRNAEIVQLLLDKKAKVSAADRKGDTALHVAMRARSKAIVEILLRNPKHSQLLYRPNRQGETPYNIDLTHQKTILGQIFGARRLNTNEDNENMLGYDLYSSALADILSEPSLSMPITVGLYAKWGSGKSFLLSKLRDEMKNFAKQWIEPSFQFSFVLFLVLLHIALIIGAVIAVSTGNWIAAVTASVGFIITVHTLLWLTQYLSQKHDWDWTYNFNVALTKKLNSFKLVLQIMFCHPPGPQSSDGLTAQPIRFYFTDQTRISSTTSGENSVVQMIGSLYEAIESDYGTMSTRLYRTFRPKAVKENSGWRWRKLCCLPYVAIFEISFINFVIGACVLTLYLLNISDKITTQIILISIALLLGIAIVANLYTWARMLRSLMFSQRRHLQRSISNLETLKSEGFLQVLRSEVTLMTDMIKCLDRLTSQQTRLVIIVDGLDSCEQDKVLLVLDAVHMLFSDANSPFIIILAIDPHAISKAVEVNSRRLFSESNIGGHDYLRNMVHLPFYLQNSGLRRVKIAQHTAQAHRRTTVTGASSGIEDSGPGPSTLGRSVSSRRLSSESGLMSSCEKLKPPPPRKGSRKLKLSESIASSIGSNLNRIGGAHDLTKMLLTDDYFSDVNPRSMRRLMNVVYITGRLLKAFQIDFNWYHLASWINITEQWPFKTSWIILYHEMHEEELDDNAPIKTLYDKIRPRIPTSKDIEPLLELDRDERKFDIFLTFHRSSLLISDLKIFLPFTINLDPYIKKVIKDEQQSLDDEGITMNMHLQKQHIINTAMNNSNSSSMQHWNNYPTNKSFQKRPHTKSYLNSNFSQNSDILYQNQSRLLNREPWTTSISPWTYGNYDNRLPNAVYRIPPALTNSLPQDILRLPLSKLSVDGVCNLINKMDEIQPNSRPIYIDVIKENNINGRVLISCDLDELKKVLKMNFGDWELFRMAVVYMREKELLVDEVEYESNDSKPPRHSTERSSSRHSTSAIRSGSGDKPNITQTDSSNLIPSTNRNSKSTVEKQVSLEEQMICGALQTLNEEACEDVLENGGDTISSHSSQYEEPHVVPPVIITDSSPIVESSINTKPDNCDYYEQNEISHYNRFQIGSEPNNIINPTQKIKTVTLASSLEKLVTIKDNLLNKASMKHFEETCNDEENTDESTPLVMNIDLIGGGMIDDSSNMSSYTPSQDLPEYQVLTVGQSQSSSSGEINHQELKLSNAVEINLWDDPETTV